MTVLVNFHFYVVKQNISLYVAAGLVCQLSRKIVSLLKWMWLCEVEQQCGISVFVLFSLHKTKFFLLYYLSFVFNIVRVKKTTYDLMFILCSLEHLMHKEHDNILFRLCQYCGRANLKEQLNILGISSCRPNQMKLPPAAGWLNLAYGLEIGWNTQPNSSWKQTCLSFSFV